MKLVASMNTHNELHRYLPITIGRLQSFCDEIVVQDDWSDDGTFEWLQERAGVTVERNAGYTWRQNEGHLHQQLLDLTMKSEPTHILSVDADELVLYGSALREMLEEDGGRHHAFTLEMNEVWQIAPWKIRVDGGWRPHPVAILYRPHSDMSKPEWQIWGRKMAGGRVPRAVRAQQRAGMCRTLPVSILHLGWANPSEREARFKRYAELDGGKYHNKAHLDSILWSDDKVKLEDFPDRHLAQVAGVASALSMIEVPG